MKKRVLAAAASVATFVIFAAGCGSAEAEPEPLLEEKLAVIDLGRQDERRARAFRHQLALIQNHCPNDTPTKIADMAVRAREILAEKGIGVEVLTTITDVRQTLDRRPDAAVDSCALAFTNYVATKARK